mmetsp:Transcript_94693/g.237534  ORF Transcript_94693/g.237534 Transcript_94693/m.237534 type:complete len:216 (-) Transcript_94693:279-926(-)
MVSPAASIQRSITPSLIQAAAPWAVTTSGHSTRARPAETALPTLPRKSAKAAGRCFPFHPISFQNGAAALGFPRESKFTVNATRSSGHNISGSATVLWTHTSCSKPESGHETMLTPVVSSATFTIPTCMSFKFTGSSASAAGCIASDERWSASTVSESRVFATAGPLAFTCTFPDSSLPLPMLKDKVFAPAPPPPPLPPPLASSTAGALLPWLGD